MEDHHLHFMSSFASTAIFLKEYVVCVAWHLIIEWCLSRNAGICTTDIAAQVLGLSGSVTFDWIFSAATSCDPKKILSKFSYLLKNDLNIF